jgi:LTXXQ motif family protein
MVDPDRLSRWISMRSLVMKRMTLIAATSASVVALGIAAAALAHGGSRMGGDACPAGHEEHCGAAQSSERPGHGMGHGMGGHGMRGHGMGGQGMHGSVSQRGLDALKAELKLTAAQQSVFEKYVAIVKTQSEARQGMHEKMHAGSADHHAMHDTMREYNRQAAVERAAVRKEVYDVLTAEQRVIADRYLGDSRMAMGGRHGHRHH